jgi:multidrug efflux pump subunit AcrB
MIQGALRNPYAVVAISLIVVILGVATYHYMVVDIFPEINIPVVYILTTHKGMSAKEIEGAISLRLEQLYMQASYVEHIESRSLPGQSLVKVFFHPSYNADAAIAELTSLTYSSLRYLPPGMFPPVLIKFGATSLPLGLLTVSSETLEEKEIRDLAYFTLRPQLGAVPGVAAPPVFGGSLRQITVFLDKDRMLSRGLSASEVVNAVNNGNLLIPAGNAKIGEIDYNVYSNSQVLVKEMNDIPVKIVAGAPIFVKDVAQVVDSTMVQTNVVRIDGHRSVYIPVMKQAGANTVAVVDGVKALLPKLTGLPDGIEVKFIFDQSLYIRQAVTNLQQEGLMGAGLAAIMIFIFLGNLRSTLVVALAIPLSVLAAFAGLYLTGQSINIMTLGGLALVIGTLLDDNIVVLENVHRHLGMGKSPALAAAEGTSEVALPMLVATISILIVYLPIIFFTGIIKFLFVPLAIAVTFAMVAAYVVSMTVAPVTMAALLKAESRGSGKESDHGSRLFDRMFNAMVNRYERILRWGLAHRTVVITSVAVLFLGTLLLFPLLGTEFFPKVDAGQFLLHVKIPEGSRIERTEAVVGQIEDVIKKVIPPSDLEQIVSNVGLPHGWMVMFTPNSGPHTAFLLVNLKSGHRSSTWDYLGRLRQELKRDFPGLSFFFQTGGIVSDVLNFGLPAPIDIQISGPKLEQVNETASKVRDLVAAVPGIGDVRLNQSMDYPEFMMKVDRTKAAYLGMTQQEVMTNVVTALSSNQNLGPGYWIDPKSNNAYFVVAQYAEQDIKDLDDFLNTPLVGARQAAPPAISLNGRSLDGAELGLGNTVYSGNPLLPTGGYVGGQDQRKGPPILFKDIVEMTRQVGPDEVYHYALQRTMDVIVNITGSDLGSVADAIQQRLATIQSPKDIQVTMRGELSAMQDTFKGFAITLPMAVVLIYLVTVGLFRSYLDPLIILCTVPLGFMGVLAMLFVTGTTINVQSFIGTLMMIGIVVANGILLVEFANRQMREGVPVREAVVRAGRVRIRPILMTALATILGLLPIAIGFGEGSESNAPLARAVIGGLLVSTVMTLLLVPIVHSLVRRQAGETSAH